MAVVYLLWGLPLGEVERYKEVLLCSVCKSKKDIDDVIRVASRDGWHSFRVSKFNEEEVTDIRELFVKAVKRKSGKKRNR